MKHHDQRLLRLAIAIEEKLKTAQCNTSQAELPTATWLQCEQTLRLIRRAQRHGWQLAAQRLRHDLQGNLRSLQADLIEFDCGLEPQQSERCQTSVRDIHADLITLREEFDTVAFDQRRRTISVTTEPIELDGVYLGPFEIHLDWSNLTDGHLNNYRVIAMDAHAAATNDSVTHPHVDGETVCEGEGRQPIRHALEQGRLLDFFVIVANLLRTYNSDSPYVSLSDWYGVECSDCGTTVCDDERWTCEKCETTVCGECYFNCPGCDSIFCNECVTCCKGCDENHCGGCLTPCSHCLTELCQGCLNDNERCSDCHDQETEETIEEPDFGADSDTVAPLHADRVGQAAVPA